MNSIPAGPYVIGVVSQKGGVGKTSLSVSLAAALKFRGYRTLLIDADTSNPNAGMMLGMEDANIGYRELATKQTKLENVTSIHGSTGMHVVLGTLNTKPFIATKGDIGRVKKKIGKSNYDFVVIDTSPGYYLQEEMGLWDEAILITTPDMPSVTGILRLNGAIRKARINHLLVLNKVRRKRYELQPDEIEDAIGEKIATVIPYEETVSVSMAEKIPAYVVNRDSAFSKAVSKLADRHSKIRKRRKSLYKLSS